MECGHGASLQATGRLRKPSRVRGVMERDSGVHREAECARKWGELPAADAGGMGVRGAVGNDW